MSIFSCQEENISSENVSTPHGYRSISEIPDKYRHIFLAYPYFNAVQSKVMNDILYCEKSLVVAAPTGSGKTALFELAIINLLMKIEEKNYHGDFKIVYLAPVKALCSERYQEWVEKFSPFGLRVLEITGDTDSSDYTQLQDFNIVITTPEKWDSLTRKWKDNKPLMQAVKLILIDEVHLVGDDTRGPTLEAVVSRLKTVKAMMLHDLRMLQANVIHKQEEASVSDNQLTIDICTIPVRFMAVSACIPNIEDVAHWLGENGSPAIFHQIGEDMRPVKLKKVVLGYNCAENWSSFRFSITLMYKLKNVLLSFSNGKPSLIFCSTRKGVTQMCSVLFKELAFRFTQEQREKLFFAANQLNEKKLKDFIMAGIGYHHAGIPAMDRYLVEDLFRAGFLPILVATSTLAMGVNLPAHLVVIMSTEHYVRGVYQEYSESQILQMIGRAGRPQFDTTAVAVIMTKSSMKVHYERLIEGKEILESSLHQHLTEHLNAEIVLNTVTDVAVAMDWIRSTFLYVCAARRPFHYSLASNSTTTQKIESKLQDLCMRELNALSGCGIVNMDGMDVRPTEMGRLMACYCIAFETMKLFQKVEGIETTVDLIQLLSKSSEFSDIQVRVSERKLLNTLNKNRGHECIRHPLSTRIKTREQKINVLIQATFGCLHISDHGLLQESLKILRIGQRVSKCFSQYVLNCIVKGGKTNIYRLVLSALRLTKCFSSRLWEDSIFVARQLDGIGAIYAGLLAASGKTSFSALCEANPRDIERILNKPPPFGNDIKDAVNCLPKYKISLEEKNDNIIIEVSIINEDSLRQYNRFDKRNSSATLVVGDSSSNILLLCEQFSDNYILNSGTVVKTIDLKKYNQVKEIKAHLINSKWVGLDVETSKEIRLNYYNSQQSVKDYLQKFAFSQGYNRRGSSKCSRDEGKIKSTENEVPKASNKKSYFEKLKERVEMLSNQSKVTLPKKNMKSSSDKYLKNNVSNSKTGLKISCIEEMRGEMDNLPQKRFKIDTLCDNVGNGDYAIHYNYTESNEELPFLNDNEYVWDTQINDYASQESSRYSNTQKSVYFSNFDNTSFEMKKELEYFSHLSQKNSEINYSKSSPPLDDEYFYRTYEYDTQSTDCYEGIDGETNKNTTELEEDSVSDVSYTKEYILGEIQIPNFDLGEEYLLAEEST